MPEDLKVVLREIFKMWLKQLGAQKVARVLVITMGDYRERTGIKVRNEVWLELLLYFKFDPSEVISNYTPKYGYSNKIFQEFSDWYLHKKL